MEKLFKIPQFTQGIEALVQKDFKKSLTLLKEALDEIYYEEIDSPEVLNHVYMRITVSQLQLNMDKELEESLKEIFLINLSDPNTVPEVLFKSVFNLLVFYHKPNSDVEGETLASKADKGIKFYEYWSRVKNTTSLPLIFYNELDFLGANLYYLGGQSKKSAALYESLKD